ncbi:MAG: B12-binding domain-containing radical SAM protein, partial [Bacilli bacterium]
MKIALSTINSKYIHPNMALRILKKDLLFNNIKSDLKEYTIKEQETHILEQLVSYDVVALSCYIYNIEYI